MSLWDWLTVLSANQAPDTSPGANAPSADEHRARLARHAARQAARTAKHAAT
jgi:hypothetical protein